MPHRSTLRRTILFTLFALLGAAGLLSAQDDTQKHGRKYKAPPPSSHIEITVLRDSSGKPIEQAHVIFHPIEGDKDKGALEVKTNEEGKAIIDVIPVGDTVTLQVIADGFQTYGENYKIDKTEMSMEIRMKRPGAQYSLYPQSASKSSSGTGSGASSSGSGKSDNSSSSGSGNSSSGSSGQSGSQSNSDSQQSQPK